MPPPSPTAAASAPAVLPIIFSPPSHPPSKPTAAARSDNPNQPLNTCCVSGNPLQRGASASGAVCTGESALLSGRTAQPGRRSPTTRSTRPARIQLLPDRGMLPNERRPVHVPASAWRANLCRRDCLRQVPSSHVQVEVEKLGLGL